MEFDHRTQHARPSGAAAADHMLAPGKRTLTEQLPVQRTEAAGGSGPDSAATATLAPAPSVASPVPLQMLFGGRRSVTSAPAEDPGAAASPAATPGSGRPMPEAVQRKMERAFGADFSAVRIHEGPQAAAVGALAYAQGTDLHFEPGQYQPDSQRGQELLGHELAHVVQQSQGRVRATTQAKGLGVNDDGGLEREADEMGARAARGEPAHAGAAAGGARISPTAGPGPVQRRARDVYRGGAELEYRKGSAGLEFDNLPTTEQADEAEIRKLIRKGLKGLPIASIGKENKTKLTGNHWSLTVETNSGTALDEHNRIQVVLELILGGPTGSTLAELKGAADEAAVAVEGLATRDVLEFEGAGQHIRDEVIAKNRKVGRAQAAIDRKEYEAPEYTGEHPLAQDWSGLKVTGTWDPGSSKPHETPWGLQVTLGVPLDELGKAGEALQSAGLTDTSKAQPKVSEKDVVWSAWDILDQMHKNAPLTDKPINEKDEMAIFKEAHGEFDFESEKHHKLFEQIHAEFITEQRTNLHNALDEDVKSKGSNQNSAPSIAALDGLAKVLAAYARGVNGGPSQGPKHTMKFVNKNPLQDVIANAASNMGGGGGWYARLRDACVDLVVSSAGSSVYRWEGHDLTVTEWAKEMKQNNVDLVAKYDAAYRSSQIGGLSTLNDVQQQPGEFKAAPVIEFRDLGDKKPSEMRDVFKKLIKKLEQ